jgi:hypothetical protein
VSEISGIGLSGALANSNIAAQESTDPVAMAPADKILTRDTVHLSEAAQVRLLRSYGNSIAMIAGETGLPIDLITTYLETSETLNR